MCLSTSDTFGTDASDEFTRSSSEAQQAPTRETSSLGNHQKAQLALMLADPKRIKESLVQAGIEVFRTRPDEIHIAERVRSHIMDSGVRVHFATPGELEVRFIGRTQASDYPNVPVAELLGRVRSIVGSVVTAQGFVETSSGSIEVKDPSDATRTLDTWHEVAYAKSVVELGDAVEAVRWLLTLDRYVMP